MNEHRHHGHDHDHHDHSAPAKPGYPEHPEEEMVGQAREPAVHGDHGDYGGHWIGRVSARSFSCTAAGSSSRARGGSSGHLLPDAFVRELEALHDRVPPLSFDAIRAVVERELVGPIGGLFAEFDPEPMAAATIAQVHAARLSDGRHVVVKVRRPDLRAVIDRDTAVLGHVARLLDRAVPPLRMLDLPVMAVELRESLRREADSRLEVTSIRRFRNKLRSRRPPPPSSQRRC